MLIDANTKGIAPAEEAMFDDIYDIYANYCKIVEEACKREEVKK